MRKHLLVSLFLLIAIPYMLHSQLEVIAISPPMFSVYVSRTTAITATFSHAVDGSSLNDTTVVVFGRQSGPHRGSLVYDESTNAVTWTPERDFFTGEVVTVILTRHIQSAQGELFKGFIWQFWIGVTNPTNAEFIIVDTLNFAERTVGIGVADFDREGSPDLAMLGEYFGTLSIWFNDGSGTLIPPYFYYPILKIPMVAPRIADFDLDGDLDLLVVERTLPVTDPDSLFFMFNDGTGFLGDWKSMVTRAKDIVLMPFPNDLDEDGDVDLVLTDFYKTKTFIYKNDGAGQFTLTSELKTGRNSGAPLLGDIDRDGDLDMILSIFGLIDTTKLLFNDGVGNVDSLYVLDSQANVRSIADFDGDHDADIVLYDPTDTTMSVYLNNGDGSFSPGIRYKSGAENWSWCTGDFDGDGDLDLLAAGEKIVTAMPVVWRSFLRLMKNDGHGNFEFVWERTIGTRARASECVDLDMDGDMDIIMSEYGRLSYVLLNGGTTDIQQVQGLPMPDAISLEQNYPNPFNSQTSIKLSLLLRESVRLVLYDVEGREVAVLLDGTKEPGVYEVIWSGLDNRGIHVGSGIYFCVLKTQRMKIARKMLLIR